MIHQLTASSLGSIAFRIKENQEGLTVEESLLKSSPFVKLDKDGYYILEVESAQDIVEFCSYIKYPLVIHDSLIEIYDDHRE